MNITDRLDQIEAVIPMAKRSGEIARHFALDHVPALVAALRAAHNALEPHYKAEVDRNIRHGHEAKSDCICEGCNAMRAIASALDSQEGTPDAH